MRCAFTRSVVVKSFDKRYCFAFFLFKIPTVGKYIIFVCGTVFGEWFIIQKFLLKKAPNDSADEHPFREVSSHSGFQRSI